MKSAFEKIMAGIEDVTERARVSQDLQLLYAETLKEPIPQEWLALLDQLA